MSIAERFRAQAIERGTAMAIDDGHRQLSFAQVQARADELAGLLRAHGVARTEPIVVDVANRATDIAAFLAAWQVGGVVVPVHLATPPAARAALLARLGSRFVIDDGISQIADAPPPARPLLDGAGTIIFTSGSTGQPKGVVLSAQRAADKLAMIQRMTGWQTGEASLVALQLTFSFGQWVSWLTLLNGGCLHLRARFDARETLSVLDSGAVQRFSAVPTMLRHLVGLQRVSPFAGHIMAGGEPFAQTLAERVMAAFPAAAIGDIYGLTETGTCDFFVAPADFADQRGTIGRAGDRIDWRLDAQTQELQIRSPWAMLGYLDEPAMTGSAFDDGWFRTGDLAQALPGGGVRLIGRAKDLILRAGNKISPLEVEAAFLSHPGVAAALAAGVRQPDEDDNEAIHLALVLAGEPDPTLDELRQWAGQRLERFKMPQVIHLVDELPSGSTGKADRKALQALATR
ncbi:MAG: class I adenylate-forming enzyme family protein [Burkholderiaceae bacterium]